MRKITIVMKIILLHSYHSSILKDYGIHNNLEMIYIYIINGSITNEIKGAV